MFVIIIIKLACMDGYLIFNKSCGSEILKCFPYPRSGCPVWAISDDFLLRSHIISRSSLSPHYPVLSLLSLTHLLKHIPCPPHLFSHLLHTLLTSHLAHCPSFSYTSSVHTFSLCEYSGSCYVEKVHNDMLFRGCIQMCYCWWWWCWIRGPLSLFHDRCEWREATQLTVNVSQHQQGIFLVNVPEAAWPTWLEVKVCPGFFAALFRAKIFLKGQQTH